MGDGPDDLDNHVQDPPVTAALRTFAYMQGGAVEPLPELRFDRGYTGAALFGIAFTQPTPGLSRPSTRKLLVKVLPAQPAQPAARKEPGRHHHARRANPGFTKRHLVQLPYHYPVDDGRHLMFQEVANGGDQVRPVSELDGDELTEAVPTIVDAILNDWNRGGLGADEVGLPMSATTVGRYVARELDAMAAAASVPAAARRLGPVDVDADWVVVDGRVRLNPLRLAVAGSPLYERRIRYAAGLSHGDLHGGNALIPCQSDGRPRPRLFQLVDLSNFEEDAPLTRDVVCLLLTTVLRYVAPPANGPGDPLPADQADALLDHLLHPGGHPPKLIPVLAKLVTAADQIGTAYASRSGWTREWRAQEQLSLACQALICTTFDNLGNVGRRWCLRLATEALEAYRSGCSSAPTPPPPDGLPVLLPGGGRVTGAAVGDGRLPAPVAAVIAPARLSSADPSGTAVPDHRAHAHPDGVPRARQPLHDEPHRGGRAERRRARTRFRFRVVATALAVVSVGGVGLFAATNGQGRRDQSLPTHRPTATTDPIRTPPSAPDRRGPRVSQPEPVAAGRRLNDLALSVATLGDAPPPGRHTFTCVRAWDHDTTVAEPDGNGTERLDRLWWTANLSGLRIVTSVDGSRETQRYRYAENELRAVLPLPAADPAEFRDQLVQWRDEQPPELGGGAAMLQLATRLHRYHPLTAVQRSVLLQELAESPDLVYEGEHRDSEGRRGIAFSADDHEGRRDTVTFSSQGRLLSHELAGADGAALSRVVLLASTRTDTTSGPACG